LGKGDQAHLLEGTNEVRSRRVWPRSRARFPTSVGEPSPDESSDCRPPPRRWAER